LILHAISQLLYHKRKTNHKQMIYNKLQNKTTFKVKLDIKKPFHFGKVFFIWEKLVRHC